MTKRTCFVISPIGENGSATRKRANQIFNYVISEVLKDSDWKVERADLISEPGIITNQIIERLSTADLVVADLSERNPNVFYELAIRHALRKPYVHLIAHDEDIPFDNAPVRAIKIDIQDLDSVNEAKIELSKQVEFAISSENKVESPISISISIQDLRKDGGAESAVIGAILSEIGGIKRMILDLQAEKELDSVKYRNALAKYQNFNESANALAALAKASSGLAIPRRYDTTDSGINELIAKELAARSEKSTSVKARDIG